MNAHWMRHARLAMLGTAAWLVLAACGGPTAPTPFTLTVSVDGTGSGTVTSSPTGIATSTTAQADFERGTTVTLTATANANSSFTGWSGACASAVGTTCAVTIEAATNVSATFDLIGGTLSMGIDGLPASATPSVRITGPSGYDATFTSDASIALSPGTYALIPGPVSDASAIYRAATRSVDIVANATSSVTVTYAQPSVLFYYDGFGSADDNVTPALTTNGFDVTFTTSSATFDTEASSGGHDLVIAMVQSSAPAFDLPTLQAYVDGGGRAIGADFGRTAGFADVFDAGFTGATNLTTADLDAPALSSGITNPIVLDNPTYITYSTGLSAEAGGSSLCAFENGDSCLVSGNSGRTALLGFLMDTVPGADDQTFWENLTLYVLGF